VTAECKWVAMLVVRTVPAIFVVTHFAGHVYIAGDREDNFTQ